MNVDVTMYDVGLGSALLITFRSDRDQVHVLADGGNASAGTGVEDKLFRRLKPPGFGRPRIDLVIGTHYDADHLDGITIILKKRRIDIGQLWLPPVADDESGAEFGRLAGDENLLANRFRGEGGDRAYQQYVAAKDRRRMTLRAIDTALERLSRGADGLEDRSEDALNIADGDPVSAERPVDEWRSRFQTEVDHAYSIVGRRGCEHVPDADVVREGTRFGSVLARLADAVERGRALLRHDLGDWIFSRVDWPAGATRAARAELAHMRIANAKDGINASALKSLVDALPNPCDILVECHGCSDRAPRAFAWTGRLFAPGRSGEVTATILSPTDRLIADRRDRIPKGVVAFRAKRWGHLEGLSDSNQLSYIIRFDAGGQGILVTGDSGFDGFAVGSDSAATYETALTDKLKGVSVIQAPHHGGISRHFYRAIESAGFAEETQKTYLLLSHEADSHHRPSMALADYMSRLPSKRPLELLFTNQPKPERVRGYRKRFASDVNQTGGQDGDVRLQFDGQEWTVVRHTIRPPA